ncbi:hypothetical protein J6590_058626 [Homalodisca vitripennis]|nr:hypothetical protein J6590_058626 [Homalodisca vitripennis]
MGSPATDNLRIGNFMECAKEVTHKEKLSFHEYRHKSESLGHAYKIIGRQARESFRGAPENGELKRVKWDNQQRSQRREYVQETHRHRSNVGQVGHSDHISTRITTPLASRSAQGSSAVINLESLWTPEEQLRLEELLIEFPPEKNENNRWRKIAEALGNRTTKQVCSRVQKYFKKLNKAGLPIPGHQLKTNNMTSQKKKPRKNKKNNTRESTFFPAHHLGASIHFDMLDEDDNRTGVPAFPPELRGDLVRKVIDFKVKDAQLPPVTHPGIECAVCSEKPLKGTRWHCLVCDNVNLCSDCVVDQVSAESPQHPPSHPLKPLGNHSVSSWDTDYMSNSFQSNNYLDANFVSTDLV